MLARTAGCISTIVIVRSTITKTEEHREQNRGGGGRGGGGGGSAGRGGIGPPGRGGGRRPSSSTEIAESSIAVGNRLKQGFKLDQLKSTGSKHGLQTYRPSSHFGRFTRNGFPIARVARCEIASDVDTIIAAWTDAQKREEWDQALIPKTSRIVNLSDTTNAVQVFEKSVLPWSLVLGRDYVYRMHRSGGAIVGIDNYTAITLVQEDCSADFPVSMLFTRGKVNSCLLLEPKDDKRVQCTLVIEKDPGGWGFLSSVVANLVAGEVAGTLMTQLKNSLEGSDNDEDKDLTVEQVARKKFMKKMEEEEKRHQGLAIIENTAVSREDLKATITLLEQKMASIRKTERAERIDLTELKSQISADLERLKATYNSSRDSKQ